MKTRIIVMINFRLYWDYIVRYYTCTYNYKKQSNSLSESLKHFINTLSNSASE